MKVIAKFKRAFWEPISSLSFPPNDASLESMGPISNLFRARIRDSPALVGLITADAAVAFAKVPEVERRQIVLRQLGQYFAACRGEGQGGESAEVAKEECEWFASYDWIGERFSRGGYAALMPPGDFLWGPLLKLCAMIIFWI